MGVAHLDIRREGKQKRRGPGNRLRDPELPEDAECGKRAQQIAEEIEEVRDSVDVRNKKADQLHQQEGQITSVGIVVHIRSAHAARLRVDQADSVIPDRLYHIEDAQAVIPVIPQRIIQRRAPVNESQSCRHRGCKQQDPYQIP